MDKLLKKIPHKPPALLIDEIVELDDLRVRCAVVRTAQAYVGQNGQLPAAIGLEIMAQAAAAWITQNVKGQGGGMLVQATELNLAVAALDLAVGLQVEVKHLPPASGTGLWRFSGIVTDAAGTALVGGGFMIMIRRG